MKKVLAAAGIASLALLATGAPANAGPEDKISICHATGSDSNPYVKIWISENGLNGHNAQGVHDGDIVPAPAGGCPAGDKGDKGDDDHGDHGDHGWDSKKVTICHATGSEKNPYVVITVSEKAWLHGHKNGHNGNADIYPVPAKGCVKAHHDDDDDHHGGEEEEENPGGGGENPVPPVEEPPVEEPPAEQPPAEQPPAVVPPAVVPPAVVPPAVVPPAEEQPAVVVPAGAGAVVAAVAVNRGFNAQTAVASDTDAGLPGWVGGLAALLTAASVVAVRRRGRTQGVDATS